MAFGNTTSITGNVTRDPELKFTSSGKAVVNFGIAVNRKFKDQEEVDFFDIECWNQLAENVSESISKGVRVLVTGRLKQDRWETPEGDKRSKVLVVADEVAPSLAWATVEVHKTERSTGSEDEF